MTKIKIATSKDLKGKNFKSVIGRSKQQESILAAIESISHTDIQRTVSKKAEPFPSRDTHEKLINFEKGLEYVYGKKPLNNQAEDLNPFASGLQKIKPSARENQQLSWLKSAVITAKSANELHKVVDQALAAGIRINACRKGEWNFAEYVILGTHFHKLKKGDLKKIMRELMLKGAEFHDRLLQNKLIGENYNELEKEVQPKIDKQLEELKKAGEKAVQGGNMISVEIDNQTPFMEFTEGSTVEPAKIMEGTKNLGLNGNKIIKVGNSHIEVKNEKEDVRNYVDMSDNSSFEITFSTSIGNLRIKMYHDKEDQVQVRAIDQEKWSELQKRNEPIGKYCLFGGMAVEEALRIGSFTRCGMWSKEQVTEQIKEANENSASETLSWVDRTRVDSKETSRQR